MKRFWMMKFVTHEMVVIEGVDEYEALVNNNMNINHWVCIQCEPIEEQ